MATAINNLVVSFNELLLETGNVLDELHRDKTANLILPSSKHSLTAKLDTSIRQFGENLDTLLFQLNDVVIWQTRLRERAQQPALEQQQQQQQQPVQQTQGDKLGGQPQGDDILGDINDFLAQVPDDADMNEYGGDLQDNINELLGENYTDMNTENFQSFDNNIFDEIDSMMNM